METTTNKVKTVAKKAVSTASNSAKKVGKSVADNPKQTLYIVGGILAIYLGYRSVKAINNFFNGDGDVDNTINFGYKIDQTKLSIGTEQARNYAAQLLTAFNHNAFGSATDEGTIYQIFKKINPEDFKLIFNEFGQKNYAVIFDGSPPANWFGGNVSEKQDLIWWLKAELNSILDYDVYKQVKSIVTQAGSVF
ncbi:hypothetical protein [Bizionia myxarmorum]|uniref:Uncharacterized protein n=1 Tax=Bizionia myxarmorum TaxID=291186 RepID=A0A5D0RCN5_9FLAO|nr:hypothetical protein [Bizionia myxarmorum]TYB78334.1 hypothetical protein ES674_00710 [Bizionia myxarmorum]